MKSCLCHQCEQGRKPCPCPASCHLPDDGYGWVDDLIHGAKWAILAFSIVFILALSAGFFFHL